MSIFNKLILSIAGGKEHPPMTPVRSRTSIKRSPRVHILPLHNVSFSKTGDEKTIKLSNLSVTGAGFLRNLHHDWTETDEVMDGSFSFKGKKYPISMKIIHHSPMIIGCAFDEPNRKVMRSFVSRYFDLELSALQLYEVDPKYLKDEKTGTPRWFQGKDNCEVYIIEQDNKIILFNITFFGNHIEGGDTVPLRYGLIVDDDEAETDTIFRMKGATVIRPIDIFSPELIESALKFVSNLEVLTGKQRTTILEKLKAQRKHLETTL